MSNSTEFLVSEDIMQKLCNADAVLADLVMSMMMDPDTDPAALQLVMENGLAIFEFQHKLVELGLAEQVMDRSDREEDANV